MLNLLLRKDRHAIKKEYSLRFLNIILIHGIIATLVFGVLLFSVHVFVLVEDKIVTAELDSIRGFDNTKQREELHTITRVINNQVKYIEKDRPTYSGFLTKILESQPNGVGLNSIEFKPQQKDEEEYITIYINGQSGLRDNMVSYSKNLEQIPQFRNVDLPLSNLTKDTNILFQITLETIGLKYGEINIEENNEQ
jgi:hypothetical protein